MGGINHQPTHSTSAAHTVEGARALSNAIIELFQGNVHVENAILAIEHKTAAPEFGIARMHLGSADRHFSEAIDVVKELQHRLGLTLSLIARSDYQPFNIGGPLSSPTKNDDGTGFDGPIDLMEQLIGAGLVPGSDAARQAAIDLNGGHFMTGFDAMYAMCDPLMEMLRNLQVETKRLAGDGTPEATQGYFWDSVENGRTPWRALFCAAHTALSNLATYWSAHAALWTQAHYNGIEVPDLFAQLDTVRVTQ